MRNWARCCPIRKCLGREGATPACDVRHQPQTWFDAVIQGLCQARRLQQALLCHRLCADRALAQSHGAARRARRHQGAHPLAISLKKALASALAASANILGTEGHRSQIRLRGHAAGWHYGTTHLFVTPNLADSCAPMFLQLHLQDVQGQVEEFQVDLNWDLEEPSLPSLPAMRRALAADPVSQARFFHEMMLLFFEEILGTLPPMTRASYHVGLARNFEDGFAASTFPGCFGDVAAFCGPLETQGRGSLHPRILCVLVGHDLSQRLRSCLQSAARGEARNIYRRLYTQLRRSYLLLFMFARLWPRLF